MIKKTVSDDANSHLSTFCQKKIIYVSKGIETQKFID